MRRRQKAPPSAEPSEESFSYSGLRQLIRRQQVAQPQPVRFHHQAADAVLFPAAGVGKQPVVIAAAGDQQPFFLTEQRRLRREGLAVGGVVGFYSTQSCAAQLIVNGIKRRQLQSAEGLEGVRQHC